TRAILIGNADSPDSPFVRRGNSDDRLGFCLARYVAARDYHIAKLEFLDELKACRRGNQGASSEAARPPTSTGTPTVGSGRSGAFGVHNSQDPENLTPATTIRSRDPVTCQPLPGYNDWWPIITLRRVTLTSFSY